MFSTINSFGDDFHNIFIKGDWNHKNITKYFGDNPWILTRLLERRSCSKDIVKLLLKQGADINCLNEDMLSDTYGYSPLMIALGISNNEEVIRVLLKEGAEVNKVDSFGKGYTPLLIYLQRADCSVGVVKDLLDFKADVNHMNVHGESPLVTAIRKSKDDAVIRLLVERGAEVNNLLTLHDSPLIVLLHQRKNSTIDTVQLLLAKCADVNCVDEEGDSALVIALKHWRDERVIQALLERGANVNIVCKYGETPLLLYLGDSVDDSCSVDIVKLLLQYKAEVNSRNTYGHSPLTTALKKHRCKEIIQVLLEEGAGVDTLDDSKMSPLCIAFRHSSNDIVKLLLDAGSSPNACKYHISALHCATDFSHSGLREDNLKLLLETGIDLNSISRYGHSLLCFALQHGAKAHDIQLLLDAGASLNTCVSHSSPLVCVTDGPLGSPLREDVIRLLLGNGASGNDQGLRVLQGALGYCKYETGAIQLLLNLPGMNAYVVADKSDESLLHLAVKNPNCRPDAVKLLLNQKAPVNKVNKLFETPLHSAVSYDLCNRRVISLLLQNGSSTDKVNLLGQTPLHCALSNIICDPRLINLLLQSGSPVNAKDAYGETALTLAVKFQWPSNILKELLIAGAHIGETKFSHGFLSRSKNGLELLKFLETHWQFSDSQLGNPETINNYRMLLKFFLLQNPEVDIEKFRRKSAFVSGCIAECLSELKIMDSLQVGHGHTFRMFVSRGCLSVEKMYNLNQILVCLMKNTFPVFFDVISARIGRSVMEVEVNKLQVYTCKPRPDLLYVERVHLNSDVVFKISQYLPDDDLLRLIVSFYKPVNQIDIDESSKYDPLLGKRNSEPSSKPPKCQKLCC